MARLLCFSVSPSRLYARARCLSFKVGSRLLLLATLLNSGCATRQYLLRDGSVYCVPATLVTEVASDSDRLPQAVTPRAMQL